MSKTIHKYSNFAGYSGLFIGMVVLYGPSVVIGRAERNQVRSYWIDAYPVPTMAIP